MQVGLLRGSKDMIVASLPLMYGTQPPIMQVPLLPQSSGYRGFYDPSSLAPMFLLELFCGPSSFLNLRQRSDTYSAKSCQ